MKFLLIALFLFTSHVFADTNSVKIRCLTQMQQFKVGGTSSGWDIVGDSNQRLVITLNPGKFGALVGDGSVRFMNDQSEDNTNSLYGAHVYATYTEGNGLLVSAGLLKYSDNKDDSASELTSGLAYVADYKKSMEDQVREIQINYLNPKLIDPYVDLGELFKRGDLKDHDLISVTIDGCRQI